MIKQLSTNDVTFNNEFKQLINFEVAVDSKVESLVAQIINNVRLNGDSALLDYTKQFDNLTIKAANLELSAQSLKDAYTNLDNETKDALKFAAQRITSYHKQQLPSDWQYQDDLGVTLGQKVTPINKVGLYVPGGQAAYPSSVLMNALPAKVAGVHELIMVVPTPNGQTNQTVLAAAYLAGVDRVFTIGGAQAIAALSYGTQTIPRVDKIVGPGNKFVATAKRQVFGQVGIDMIAGPSEVLIIADAKANPKWLAMDMFAQAEHDPQAQSILITDSPELLTKTKEQIKELLPNMPRHEIIAKSLAARGALILTKNLDEAVELANTMAPEHLELALDNADNYVEKVKNAGAIFIGHKSCEAFGDYVAGPNHVLPTSGTARFASPLGVYDFVKRSSLINLTAANSSSLIKVTAQLAKSEGLSAHQQSALFRLENE